MFNLTQDVMERVADRFQNLVSNEKKARYLPTPGYEVLVFHTKIEYELCNDEKEFKKKIVAKFRDYGHAHAYAHFLLVDNCTIYKAILRA